MNFAELAAAMRREELEARARREPAPLPAGDQAVAVLEDAAARLEAGPRGSPAARDPPNRVVKDALRAAGHPQDGPTGQAVWKAVGQLMRARHPDWPDSGCLIRLCEAGGPGALRALLLEAAEKVRQASPARGACR